MTSAVAIFLLSTTFNASRAFQISPLHRAVFPSHVLMSDHLPSTKKFFFRQSPLVAALRQSTTNDDDNDANDLESQSMVGVVDPNANAEANANNAIAKWATKLKQALSTQPASFFISLCIFLFPFFLVSTGFAYSAWAVQSGGRIGGSFGGSSRSSSSRTYSAPSSGYSRGYSRGYSSGYYSRPSTNVIVTPGISPFYSPFYSPFSPFYARPSGVVVTTGPSFGGIFFFAGFFILASLVLSNIGSSASDTFGNALGSVAQSSALGPGVSVAEISVALEVPDRDSPNSILSALDRLARTARTDSRVGLQNLTSQVAIELLRRKSSIVAASTHATHFRDEKGAQREYNNISVRQRGKFQRETVSKFGGVDYSDARMRSAQQGGHSAKATVAVVTIVMMIDGDSTSKQLSSKVNSIRDVEDALSRIAADAKMDYCLRGAEILWTPEERDETLTMKEVLADYSSLRSV